MYLQVGQVLCPNDLCRKFKTYIQKMCFTPCGRFLHYVTNFKVDSMAENMKIQISRKVIMTFKGRKEIIELLLKNTLFSQAIFSKWG